MRALDTSVLARWMLNDDPAQAAVARELISEPAWISQTVLLELGWVLLKALKLPRAIVAEMLQQVIDLETVEIENSEAVHWAIGRFRRGADWADMVHIAACPAEVAKFASFDRAIARKAGATSPVAVETL